MKSRFLEILNQSRRLIKEDVAVRGDEESELPDVDDEIDVSVDDDLPSPEEPEVEEPQPEEVFTNREVDLLNIAVQIFRADENNSIETKNELSDLFENKQYEDLMGRLISIADDLTETVAF